MFPPLVGHSNHCVYVPFPPTVDSFLPIFVHMPSILEPPPSLTAHTSVLDSVLHDSVKDDSVDVGCGIDGVVVAAAVVSVAAFVGFPKNIDVAVVVAAAAALLVVVACVVAASEGGTEYRSKYKP